MPSYSFLYCAPLCVISSVAEWRHLFLSLVLWWCSVLFYCIYQCVVYVYTNERQIKTEIFSLGKTKKLFRICRKKYEWSDTQHSKNKLIKILKGKFIAISRVDGILNFIYPTFIVILLLLFLFLPSTYLYLINFYKKIRILFLYFVSIFVFSVRITILDLS